RASTSAPNPPATWHREREERAYASRAVANRGGIGEREERAYASPGGGGMTAVVAPHWSAHLAPGAEADLGLGATLPGAWTARWAADPGAEIIATPAGRRITAAELEQLTAAAAGRYAAAGLAPGDRIMMSAGPSVELIVAYVAALRYGLTVVPANTAYTAVEMATIAADARPKLAVVDDLGRAPGIPGTTPDLAGLPAPGATAGSVPLDRVAPTDPALIVFTSGT